MFDQSGLPPVCRSTYIHFFRPTSLGAFTIHVSLSISTTRSVSVCVSLSVAPPLFTASLSPTAAYCSFITTLPLPTVDRRGKGDFNRVRDTGDFQGELGNGDVNGEIIFWLNFKGDFILSASLSRCLSVNFCMSICDQSKLSCLWYLSCKRLDFVVYFIVTFVVYFRGCLFCKRVEFVVNGLSLFIS